MCLAWLLLITILTPALPLYAADDVSAPATTTADSGLVTAVPAPESTLPAGLKTGDQVLVALDDSRRIAAIKQLGSAPTVVSIENGKVKLPDLGLSKAPGKLAAAGLILLPLDSGLVKVIPRTPAGEKSDGFTEVVNRFGSKEVLLTTIAGMYFLGSDYDKDTARLALAAVVNSAITTEGVKLMAGRERPAIAGDELRFHGPSFGVDTFKSFPSGHTSAAFAVATVLAKRHPKQKWLYYGLAAAVGYARIRKSAHFPSDVLVGAAVGIHAGNNVIQNGARILSIKL